MITAVVLAWTDFLKVVKTPPMEAAPSNSNETKETIANSSCSSILFFAIP